MDKKKNKFLYCQMENLVYNHDKGEEDTAQLQNILRNKHLNIQKKILVASLILFLQS